PEDVVQDVLVVTLALVEVLDHQDAGKPIFVCSEAADSCGRDCHAVGGNRPATDFRAGIRVDDRHGTGEDAPGAEHRVATNPGAFGHDAAAPDIAIVFDDDRRRLWRFEHATNSHAAGQVNVRSDLRTRADGRPRIHHRVVSHIGADV